MKEEDFGPLSGLMVAELIGELLIKGTRIMPTRVFII